MTKLTDHLFRGPRPRSYADLQAQGFTHACDLETGSYEVWHEDLYETELGLNFGITQTSILCSDILPPSAAKVYKFLALADLCEKNGFKLYVHCLHGEDRTGFLCAVYRMQVQGWTYEEAVKEMFDLGFHKLPYLFWLAELQKWGAKR